MHRSPRTVLSVSVLALSVALAGCGANPLTSPSNVASSTATSTTAASLLSQIATGVPTSDNLSQADLTKQVDTLQAFITQRT